MTTPEDPFHETLSLPTLQQLDKGLLSRKETTAFKAELKAAGKPYKPYFERVGPGFTNLCIELKKDFDREVLPGFTAVLGKLTDDRFGQAYCDVRVYPQSRPFDAWVAPGAWEGETLDVVVSMVMAVPDDDMLDSLTQMNLLGLFEESPWQPEVKKLGKKGRLNQKLNINTLIRTLEACSFHDFNPGTCGGVTLEVVMEACAGKDFDRLADLARGPQIQALRRVGKSPFKGKLEAITPDNAGRQVPILIAQVAEVLGVQGLDPRKLRSEDHLHALMGYDRSLTQSLIVSITNHFGILSVSGGPRMVTVGNAVEFAQEFSGRDED